MAKVEITELLNRQHDQAAGIDTHKVSIYGYDPIAGTPRRIAVNPDGEVRLNKYPVLYATEYGATYNYIAKYSATGAWIVQRETISTGIRDYAFQGNQTPALDPDTVVTAWTGRATNDYGQYSE